MATWKRLEQLELNSVVQWKRDDLRLCDPYLVWAEASTLGPPSSRMTRCDEPGRGAAAPDVAVLVELNNPAKSFLQDINANPPPEEPLLFLPSGAESLESSRFITGLVSRTGLARLVHMVKDQTIERFTLQDSRRELGREVAWKSKRAEEEAEEASSKPIVPPHEVGERRTGKSFLGIIDDGLPFARVRGALSGRDSSVYLWDQGWEPRNRPSSGAEKPGGNPVGSIDPDWTGPWDLYLQKYVPPPGSLEPVRDTWAPRGFFYGRRLRPRSCAADSDGLREEEDQIYVRSRYFIPAPRHSHGAAVLGLMAPWLAIPAGEVTWPEHLSGLAMVQLPSRTVDDTSGGSLAMRVLDAMRFILWQESKTRPDPSVARSVLINLSYGVHAGPHDGTSMIERAFEEMLRANPHLHLVLPAGNAHRSGCHAQRLLAASGSPNAEASIQLSVVPDNGADCFVEIWFPAGADVSLHIRPPGESSPFEVRRGQAWLQCDTDADARPTTVRFGAIYPDAVAQGTRGTMALLAIGPTKQSGKPDKKSDGPRGSNQRLRRNVIAVPGLWELKLRNCGRTSLTIDAWVERGDAPPDQAWGSRQAHFPDSCDAQLRQDNATPEGTLNGIATLRHARAHVVGAMRRDGKLSDYSAAGLERSAGLGDDVPDSVVVADWSLNLPGVKTMGFKQGVVTRINGTSAACAVYTRALAEVLGKSKTPTPQHLPAEVSPEVDCAAEYQPAASRYLRGYQCRENWPFEVFCVDRWLGSKSVCQPITSSSEEPLQPG